SPRVIATDEIGKAEEVEALEQMLQAGVSVVTSVHGNRLAELQTREHLNKLLSGRFFERLILLSRREGAGTVEAIYNGKSMERLC
ncbi:MAG: stage III sporulation protein AA, partial [Clostridia bacterium]|nr:stage III sporulation protein AA [Clostridia bacterium]